MSNLDKQIIKINLEDVDYDGITKINVVDWLLDNDRK